MPCLSHEELRAVQRILTRPLWTRVWIIQEIVAGGFHLKLHSLRIFCGTKELAWMYLVIAAARMKSYRVDQRQYFPNIDNILELDAMRDSPLCLRPLGKLSTQNFSLSLADMLSRCRRFGATNPRDKLHAVNSLIVPRAQNLFDRTRYEASIEDVDTDLAIEEYTKGDFEFLPHCGNANHCVPSWVPDWSVIPSSMQLPARPSSQYLDVPWWAEAPDGGVSEKNEIEFSRNPYTMDRYIAPSYTLRDYHFRGYLKNKELALSEKTTRILRLMLDTEGFEICQELEGFHAKSDLAKVARESGHDLGENAIIGLFRPTNSGGTKSHKKHGSLVDDTVATVSWGERITERQQKRRIVQDLSPCQEPYSAGSSRLSPLAINRVHQTLSTEDDWSKSTHGSLIDRERTTFNQWLPEVDKTWKAEAALLTPTTNGLLEAAELNQKGEDAMKACFPDTFTVSRRPWLHETEHSAFADMEDVGSNVKDSFVPFEWDSYEAVEYRYTFDYLAALWHQQPYDLYHRPFQLLNVVPDPYRNDRKRKDVLAKRKTRKYRPMPHTRFGYEAGRSEVSMSPQGVLDLDIEKDALGRRFFVTRKGYFGIRPQELRPGDRIAIIFGLAVPLLLRKHVPESGPNGYKVLGETYVHDIMRGEVVQQWRDGYVEAGKIVLR